MGKTRKKSTIRSMTGFGRGTAKSPLGTIVAEIKTFNHKNLSITCTAFDGFFLLEERMKEIIGKKLVRGKVFAKISRENTTVSESTTRIKINRDVIKDLLKEIKKTKKEFSITGDIEISDLLKLPGVIEQVNQRKETQVWPALKKAVETATAELLRYREEEGAKLSKDLQGRLKKIQKNLALIRKEHQHSIREYKKRLTARIAEVAEHKEIDKIKIEEEVAVFARNCDIEEEMVRLGNHAGASLAIMDKPEKDVGKKLDFIAQEMHREINTIGAKTGEYKVSHLVISIKSEIEKIREQLSNIE